jgi:hypothetical protein
MSGVKASDEHPLPFGNPTQPLVSTVVEPKYVVLHEEASLLVGHQLKHLQSQGRSHINPPFQNPPFLLGK